MISGNLISRWEKANNSFWGTKRGQAYLDLTPKLSQSVHSTHKPSSLRQPSQCIRRHTLHSWTARTSSFSAGSPHATQAKFSAIITPPFVLLVIIFKLGMHSSGVNAREHNKTDQVSTSPIDS